MTYKQNYPIITPQKSGFLSHHSLTLISLDSLPSLVQLAKGIPPNRGTNTVTIIEQMTVFLCEAGICSTGGRGGIKTQVK